MALALVFPTIAVIIEVSKASPTQAYHKETKFLGASIMSKSKNKQHSPPQAQPKLPTIPVGTTVLISETFPDGLAISKTVESSIVSIPQNLSLPTATVEGVVETANKPTARKARQRYNVDAARFLTIVNTAPSKAEAAKALGMPIAAVTSRMQYYRNVQDAEGNKLDVKSFQRGPNRLKVQELNSQVKAAIAAQTVPATVAPVAAASENNVG